MYWSNVEIPGNPERIINNVPYLDPREFPTPHSSAAVQGTAYALMTYLMYNRLEESEVIMKWLQTQREVDSAFVNIQVRTQSCNSSKIRCTCMTHARVTSLLQDSIVALRALLEYVQHDTNRNMYHMRVDVIAAASDDFRGTVTLQGDYFAQDHTLQVSDNNFREASKQI